MFNENNLNNRVEKVISDVLIVCVVLCIDEWFFFWYLYVILLIIFLKGKFVYICN